MRELKERSRKILIQRRDKEVGKNNNNLASKSPNLDDPKVIGHWSFQYGWCFLVCQVLVGSIQGALRRGPPGNLVFLKSKRLPRPAPGHRPWLLWAEDSWNLRSVLSDLNGFCGTCPSLSHPETRQVQTWNLEAPAVWLFFLSPLRFLAMAETPSLSSKFP